jgi:hypothetical protein
MWILVLLVGVIVELLWEPSLSVYALATVAGVVFVSLCIVSLLVFVRMDNELSAAITAIVTTVGIGAGVIWIMVVIGGVLTKLIMEMV